MSSARSTIYRVELSARAESDLQSIYDEIGASHSEASSRWFNRLESLVLSLDTLPARGTRTREDRILRQLLFGNKPHVYRIIYSIDLGANTVFVLHIRHGAQSPFRSEEIRNRQD